MSKQRIKLTIPTIATRTEAEAVMNELAAAANHKRRITARLDAAILKLKDDSAPLIAECDQVITIKTDTLRAWAEANPQEFTKGRKSIEFLAGILGFRTGTPKLSLLSRAWTWEKALEQVLAKGFQFTRTKVELDKDSVLAFYANAKDAKDLAAIRSDVLAPCGMKVVQDESFYVEPKLTDPA